MKNLKKLLAVILTVAMLATMVPAFAADDEGDYVYSDEATTLNTLALYNGTGAPGGEFVADLGKALDRESGITMLVRMLGFEAAANAMTDAEVDAALAGYSDVSSLSDWAKKSMAYAVKNNLVKGTSATTLGAKDALLGKAYATIILRAMGYTPDYNNAATELVAIGGLTAAQATDLATKELTRDDFVGITYAALMAKYANGKTIIDVLVANGSVNADKAEDLGLVVPSVLKIKASATGRAKLTVTFNMAIDTTKAVISVKKNANVQNIKVKTFAVDTKSVVIELTGVLSLGSYVITVTGLSDTALTATVAAVDETFPKLEVLAPVLGMYREAATAASSEAMAVIGTVVVRNQYNEDCSLAQQANVIATSTKGLIVGNAIGGGAGLQSIAAYTSNGNAWTKNYVHPALGAIGEVYIHYNAAGEADGMTSSATNTTVGANVTLFGVTAVAPTKNYFIVGEKITVSYIHKVTGAFVSSESTVVGESKISDVELWGIHNPASATVVLTAGQTNRYELTGKYLTQAAQWIFDEAMADADMIITNSNPAVLVIPGLTNGIPGAATFTKVLNFKGGVDPMLVINITAPTDGYTAGTTTITAICKATGVVSKKDIVVPASKKIDTLSITAPALAVANEEVVLPFVAVDQFGVPMTIASELNIGMLNVNVDEAFSVAGSAGATLLFVQDYVKNTAKLVLTTVNETSTVAKNIVITGITGMGKMAQVTIQLQPKAKADVVSNVVMPIVGLQQSNGITVDASRDSSYTIDAEDVTVLDQYGRVYTDEKYDFTVVSANPAFVAVGAATYNVDSDAAIAAASTKTLNGATGTTKLYAANKVTTAAPGKTGSVVITVGVTGAVSYTFNLVVKQKSEVVSYSISELAKIYEDASEQDNTGSPLEVLGLLADGGKVAVPTSDYTAVVGGTYVSINEDGDVIGTDEDSDFEWAAGVTERTVPVVVTVDGNALTTIVTRNIVVSNVAPVPTTLSLEDGDVGTLVDGDVSVDLSDVTGLAGIQGLIADVVVVTDQYGKEIGDTAQFIITNFSKDAVVDGLYLDSVPANVGQSFDLTLVTSNGKTIKFRVVVATNEA